MDTATFNVSGMHCSSCSMLITMNLRELPGIGDVDCSHVTGRTEVKFDSSKVSRGEIWRAILDAGYSPELLV